MDNKKGSTDFTKQNLAWFIRRGMGALQFVGVVKNRTYDSPKLESWHEPCQLSNRLVSVLNLLEPDVAPKQQVARLAEQELRRRLARYQLSDRLFRQKYGMTLEEFETAEVVKQRGDSFEVENDH